MVKEGIVKDAVFILVLDRVPRDTSLSTHTSMMAFGDLVSPRYYYPPTTSVSIEELSLDPELAELSFHATTNELIYGLKNGTIASGTYQSIVDSGTVLNFVPSAAAAKPNHQFSPAAVYNETLRYWPTEYIAKALFAAFKIDGKAMCMDPQDMIVRSLNGLSGYEDIYF